MVQRNSMFSCLLMSSYNTMGREEKTDERREEGPLNGLADHRVPPSSARNSLRAVCMLLQRAAVSGEKMRKAPSDLSSQALC